MPEEDSDLADLELSDVDVEGMLDLVSITETSTAFEDEFTAQTERMAKAPGERRWFSFFVKMWDSTLDRRRCPICSGASLEIRPLGLSFSLGQPGHAHPRCRCVSVTFLISIPYTPNEAS